MKIWIVSLFLMAPLPAAQTLQVVHEKTLWWDGRGTIEFRGDEIVYSAEKTKDSRSWRYTDIQFFDRISPREFVILSYEDQPLLLGRDREYRFRITEGELTDALFERISRSIGRPVTDRVAERIEDPAYSVPVKHEHGLGGCEGTLQFSQDAIYYVTDHKEDAREWRIDRDVESVWSADPYRLDIYVHDNNRREMRKTRLYRFSLKEPLDPRFYRGLKLELYNLESSRLRR